MMGPLLNSVSQEQALTVSFLKGNLKVKEELIAASRAIHCESTGDFEKAVTFWLEARNYEKASLLFARKIVPLYFLNESRLGEDQLLTSLEKLNKDENEAFASMLAPVLEFI